MKMKRKQGKMNNTINRVPIDRDLHIIQFSVSVLLLIRLIIIILLLIPGYFECKQCQIPEWLVPLERRNDLYSGKKGNREKKLTK